MSVLIGGSVLVSGLVGDLGSILTADSGDLGSVFMTGLEGSCFLFFLTAS